MKVGYARCSTDGQDLEAQTAALMALGVDPERIYSDHGVSGRKKARPGLDSALAAVRDGDMLVVTKVDRLSRSMPDLREIADKLHSRGVGLQMGGSVYDPADPMGQAFFGMMAVFAELESDMIRARTRDALAQPSVRAKMKGRRPGLTKEQDREIRVMMDGGDHTVSSLSRLFRVGRASIRRSLQRTEGAQTDADGCEARCERTGELI